MDEIKIPQVLPILAIEDLVLFPEITETIESSREKDFKLLTNALRKDKLVGILTKAKEGFAFEKIGTVGKIQEIKEPKEIFRQIVGSFPFFKLEAPSVGAESLFLAIKGISRFKILRIIQDNPYYLAETKILSDQISSIDNKIAAFTEAVKSLYGELLDLLKLRDKDELLETIMRSQNPSFVADFAAATLPIWSLSSEDKQIILEILDIKERLEKISYFLNREIAKFRSREKVKEELGDIQKEFVIRQQIKALEDELKKMGKAKENSEVKKYQEKAEKAKMPKEVKKEFDEELVKFSQASPQDPTNQYRASWLDWMVSLPWSKGTKDRHNIEKAEKILEEDHYGLEKVKKRILEFLAVKKLKPESKSPILCFIGPPGTGKTSVGRSIAKTMNRRFIRISLGGAKDERQIRGFERTYVGALPGVVLQELKKAGANNPVFMIDEIDKVGLDWRGDPTSALLEVLDPEQNFDFRDHYLGVPFNLSKVMFICTGNLIDPIQPALRDRMEILEFPGYTREEKLMIAKKYLVPKQIETNGLNSDQIQFGDDALSSIISDYTKEAGVRNQEREIGNVCRKIATKIAKEEISQEIITKEKLSEILGPRRYISTLKERISRPGVAIGLAWTESGGDILFIETEIIREAKKSELEITGNVAKIMQESAKAALTFIEANLSFLKIKEERSPVGKKIHIHIPEAAIPKDGPSAGITILTALASLLTKRKVKDDVAMTGEITLRGKILPVGGIKEKILAAKESGIKTIILPKENKKDIPDLPQSIRNAVEKKEIKLEFISEMKEAINLALS